MGYKEQEEEFGPVTDQAVTIARIIEVLGEIVRFSFAPKRFAQHLLGKASRLSRVGAYSITTLAAVGVAAVAVIGSKIQTFGASFAATNVHGFVISLAQHGMVIARSAGVVLAYVILTVLLLTWSFSVDLGRHRRRARRELQVVMLHAASRGLFLCSFGFLAFHVVFSTMQPETWTFRTGESLCVAMLVYGALFPAIVTYHAGRNRVWGSAARFAAPLAAFAVVFMSWFPAYALANVASWRSLQPSFRVYPTLLLAKSSQLEMTMRLAHTGAYPDALFVGKECVGPISIRVPGENEVRYEIRNFSLDFHPEPSASLVKVAEEESVLVSVRFSEADLVEIGADHLDPKERLSRLNSRPELNIELPLNVFDGHLNGSAQVLRVRVRTTIPSQKSVIAGQASAEPQDT
jgi:hypothetical protein